MSATPCSACGAPLTVYERVCECGALVNAAAVAELRTRARIGTMARDPQMATTALQRALQLVPEDHPEHAALRAELDALLSAPVEAGRGAPPELTSRRQLVALLAITLGLLLLLLWPLITGRVGGGAGALDDTSGADTSPAAPGRHPGGGALYPPP